MSEGIPEAIKRPEIKYKQLFINNEWVDSVDGSTFSVEDPATGKEICRIAEGKKADIDVAVASARAAFKHGSAWRKFSPAQRGKLLHKLADLIERDANYIASLESWDGGKIYKNTFNEVMYTTDVLRYFAGWSDKDHGKTIPYDNDHFAYTKHEPIGVCGAIIPWNFPFVLLSWKFAPCIAMGNVFVLKPAEITPLSALYFAALTKEAGFPSGVVSVVPGYGSSAGAALSLHMDVDKIAFTGSPETGRLIQKASADSNLKKVSLELGGKSPNIIFADTDLDFAVALAQTAIFHHSGQVCSAGSRTFVEEKIYDEFVEKSVKKAQRLTIGDPMDPETQQGPQVCKTQKDKILRMIQTGKEQGCTVRCGGVSVEGQDGYFIQPTVLTDLQDDMEISQKEVFGPVQQIYKFKDISEVIERANKTSYGLAAAVFTEDVNKAISVANAMESGTVWINTYFEQNPSCPFGGFKTSGIGRDLGEYALREYTQVKVVIMRLYDPTH